MDEEKMKAAADAGATGDFETMTLVQQIKAIDSVIDESVRQFLVMDGGNMEVIERYGNDDHKEKYLKPLLEGDIRSGHRQGNAGERECAAGVRRGIDSSRRSDRCR